MSDTGRNRELTRLLKDLNWSQTGFAKRVAERCAMNGHPAQIAASTVTRWMHGSVPGPHTAKAACEVLTLALAQLPEEGLRREILPSTLGWTDDALDLVDGSLEYRDVAHAITVSIGLWRAETMHRRDLLTSAMALPALAVATRDALVLPPEPDTAHTGGQRVGASDVELIRTQTRNFQDLDSRFGGGRLRKDFAAFLDNHAGPMLNGTYDDATGRQLYAAVANAHILSGWMCHDDDRNGLAQRYHTAALRLAHAVGDKPLVARVLVHQARLLADSGERKEALSLACSAVYAADSAPPAVRAYTAITQARAWAYVGNPGESMKAVDAARSAFDQPGTSPEWLDWFDRPELEGQAAWALTMAGYPEQAESALAVARGKGANMRRDNIGLVITEAEIARLRGDAEQQQSLTAQAAALATDVKSKRVTARISRLQAGLPVDGF